MSFLKFILKNPFRRKTSAFLAIVGIAIGIIVIVALGGITDGLVNTFEDTIHAGDADFQISGKETGDSAYGTNTIDASWTDKISNVSGVEEAFPIYVVLTSVGDDYMNTLIGIDPDGTQLTDISMKEGRLFENNSNEVILGEIYADDNGYKIGDNIEIDSENFEVVGIFESGDSNMAGGVFTSISKVGELMDDEDSISNIYVKVEKGADPQTVADSIDEKYGDNITTITSVMEMSQMADMLNMLQASTWAISLLAIVVGGLGIITIMSGLMLLLNRKMGIGDRLLIQDAFNLNTMSGLAKFVKNVLFGTLIIEGVGAVLYMLVFVPEFGARGIWISVFNSVSAFCNAGIDIIAENSLCNYATNPLINIVTSALIILGGLGYIVWWDVLRVIKGRTAANKRMLTVMIILRLFEFLITFCPREQVRLCPQNRL